MSVRSLSLLFGPQIPQPAPVEVSEALERIEIDSAIGERGTFRLTFRVDDPALPGSFLLDSGDLMRVSLVLNVERRASVVMEGVMVVHTLATGANGGTSLIVSGEDLTLLMDLVIVERSFSGMPLEARVRVLLAAYSAFGVVPFVIPPLLPTTPLPAEPIPHQQGTDYDYIRSLADIVGFRFTLNPGPAPGSSLAYWGPEPRPDPSGPALSIDFGRHTIETLQLSFDAGALLAKPARPTQVMTGHGTLDVERAGVRLRAGSSVEVRGAADPFGGLFHVSRVRDTITNQNHSQAFELVRAGIGAAAPG